MLKQSSTVQLNLFIQAMFSSHQTPEKCTMQKKILRHIKLAVHAWSTKCRRNQKLIAQFGCILRVESFEPN